MLLTLLLNIPGQFDEYVDPGPDPEPEPEVVVAQGGGGYGFNAYDRTRRQREEEEDESKTPAALPSAAQAGPGSAVATPQAPAADLEITRQLVAHWTGEADREQLNRRAQRALDYALRAESVLAMQLFERELARQLEEDADMQALLLILADD